MRRRKLADYRELAPCPSLAPYIVCTWVRTTHADGASPSALVLPDGCVDLVWIGASPPVIAGPATRPVTTSLPPDSTVVGIRFRPGVAPSFLGLRMSEIRDRQIELVEVWGPRRMEQFARAGSDQTADAKSAALQAALLGNLPGLDLPDRRIAAAVAALTRHPSTSVVELSGRLGISERQLRRSFEATVGYGPRMFSRVLRFQRALKRLRRPTERPSLASLAADLGYADQAHMTREFTQLAGLPPTALLASEAARR